MIVLGVSVFIFLSGKDFFHSQKSLLINGVKISLGDIESNKDGFLIIKLIEDDVFRAPTCYSAFLTVEGSKVPIYIEKESGDIFQSQERFKGVVYLAFATNKSPKNLYVELGKRGNRKDSRWYHFDMENKKCMLLESGCPFEIHSVFDESKLINVSNSIKSDIRAFNPKNPQPMHFIVYANPVINPLTRRVSTGGRTNTERYLPVNTEDVINDNGYLKKTGGLILTDNPDIATFVLILDFTYVDEDRKFYYADNSTTKQYDAVNKFELYNLVSNESIETEIKTYATYIGEEVAVTHSSKGKQMFAGTIATRFEFGRIVGRQKGLSATEFPGYVEFVSK